MALSAHSQASKAVRDESSRLRGTCDGDRGSPPCNAWLEAAALAAAVAVVLGFPLRELLQEGAFDRKASYVATSRGELGAALRRSGERGFVDMTMACG